MRDQGVRFPGVDLGTVPALFPDDPGELLTAAVCAARYHWWNVEVHDTLRVTGRMTSLSHIVILHGMNACRVVDALAKAEPLRLPLIQKAMAKHPKCEVGECQVKLDPQAPSGWIIEWFSRDGKHVRTWCCDMHRVQTEDLNNMRRSGLSEPVSNLT